MGVGLCYAPTKGTHAVTTLRGVLPLRPGEIQCALDARIRIRIVRDLWHLKPWTLNHAILQPIPWKHPACLRKGCWSLAVFTFRHGMPCFPEISLSFFAQPYEGECCGCAMQKTTVLVKAAAVKQRHT